MREETKKVQSIENNINGCSAMCFYERLLIVLHFLSMILLFYFFIRMNDMMEWIYKAKHDPLFTPNNL